MRYRLYLYSYEDGWEKIIYRTIEEVNKALKELDPYEYGQYIIIEELKDRDNIYDAGEIARPRINKLKPRKKH